MTTTVVNKLEARMAEKLAGVEALIFDLDDVLFDKGEWIMHSLEYAAERMGFDGQHAWELAVKFREEQGKVDFNIYNHLLNGLGQSDSARNVKALSDFAAEYRPMRGQIEFYPGVQNALQELRETQKLGLVTDGVVLCQRAKVNALGLKDIFHEILYSDGIAGRESRKPDPRPFESMWLSLKTRKDKVLIVGANPRKDFELRKKEGFLTLRVLSGEYAELDYQSDKQRADFCLPTVAHLPGLLELARSVPEEHEDAAATDTTLRIA
jgi:putative hydrolase of the HAD superfamily